MAKRSRKKSLNGATTKLERPSPWLGWALLAIVVFAYWNTLGHAFVFDDATLITQNPQVTQLQWGQMLGRSGYRPVRTFTYALNYLVGGLDPWGYHLFNLLLHGLNAILVYLLFWWLSQSTWLAFAGALLWAVHPAQTAAVAWVSGRKDLLALFFLLLGSLAYIAYRRCRGGKMLGAILACFALATLSKEVALVFPALWLLLEMHLDAVERRTSGQPARSFTAALTAPFRRSPLLAALVCILTAGFVYYAIVVVGASRKVGFWGGTYLNNLGTSFKLFVHYLKLAVFPYPLIADYTGGVFPVSRGFSEAATIASLLATIAFVAVAVWIYRRDSLATLAMLWFLAALLPILQIIPFHELAADHFLYLPLVGACLLAGSGFKRLAIEAARPWTAGLLLAMLAVGAVWVTIDRNQVWKDEETLWKVTYRQAPNSYRANLNLSTFLYQRGDWREGIELAKRAIELKPDDVLAYANLGSYYRQRGSAEIEQGRLDVAERFENMALEQLRTAVRLKPQDLVNFSTLADCYKDLALIEDKRGKPGQALMFRKKAFENYMNALSLAEGSETVPYLWFNVGMVFVDQGLFDQALDYLRQGVRLRPDYDALQYWSGYCEYKLKRYREAVPYFEQTLLLTEDAETYSLLANCYEQLGRIDRAIEVYRRALKSFPETVEFHHNLGVLLYRRGDVTEATQHLRRALELAPQGELAPRIRQMLREINRQ